MDPREFNRLAGNLAGRQGDPAAVRSGISRSYDAALHVGCDFLEDLGLPNLSNHGNATKCLDSCDDLEVAEAGSLLKDLQSDRIKADYRLDNTQIEFGQKARDAVITAGEIIRMLDDVPEARIRQLGPGVQAYYVNVLRGVL